MKSPGTVSTTSFLSYHCTVMFNIFGFVNLVFLTEGKENIVKYLLSQRLNNVYYA